MANRASVCFTTGKRRFRDHRYAVRALHNAARCRAEAHVHGLETIRRERRSYLCEECNGWHLTSQAEWTLY